MNRTSLNTILVLFLSLLSVAVPARAGLLHRYSFTADANDSVGTNNGTLNGGATIVSNAVVLDGATGYVEFPPDLVSNLTSITMEIWATDTGSSGWARLYDFGTSSGGPGSQGGGLTYMYLSLPTAGGSLRSAYNAGAGEQLVDVGRPPLGQAAHIVWTSDGPSKTGKLFVNGLLAGVNTNLTITPASIGHTFNDWLGRSQYNDPYFNGTIDELRIYDSAVSPLQSAVDAALGPDKLYSDPGAPLSLSLNVSNSMTVGGIQKASVTGNFAAVTNVNLTTVVAFSSGSPGVVAVLDASGRLGAVGAGSAVISASFNGLTNTQSITVVAAPPKMLHRYSFTTDASDSVGGADGILNGNAIITNGVVYLDGSSAANAPPGGTFVNLPTNIVRGLSSITVESWVTDFGSANWARIFDFGNSSGGPGNQGGGTQYMFLSLPSGASGNLRGAYTITGGGAGEQVVEWPAGGRPPVNQETHIVWETDAISHTGKLYANGALVGINTNVTLTPNDLGPTSNDWLGKSQFNDPFFNGTIDEVRIYDSALSPLQVAIDLAAGPDTIITNTGNLLTLSLTANTNMNVGTFQQAGVVGNFANVTNVNLGSVVAYTSSNTNTIRVDSLGNITAVSGGTATITATYSGKSAAVTISAIAKPVILTHRYSFTSDASDSIGGANGTLAGNAVITNGAVALDGSSSVQLPVGLLDTNYDAVTIEAWTHVNVTPDGAATHLFGFGNLTPAGFIRLRVHSAGNNSIQGINGGTGEQTATQPGPVAGSVHIASVYYPLAGYLQFFVNGQLANSNTISALLNQVRGTNDLVNAIGQYIDGTGGMNGTIDEFRIYNGALSMTQVRTSFAGGPNTTNFNAGTITSVAFGVYSSFINGTIERPWVRASSATVSNIDLTGVSDVSFSSGNTNVVVVLPDGRLQAVGTGLAAVTAIYQGVGQGVVLSVIPQQTMLTHRYSFTNDASDSVGTANGTLHGDATIANGALVLPNDPAIGRGSYLDLPGDLIDGYPAVTIEAWVNLNASGAWTRLFDFGNYNAGGGGQSYIFLTPHSGGALVRLAINDGNGEQIVDNNIATLDSTGVRHVVSVFDPTTLQIGAIYLDGVLASSAQFTKPLTAVIDTHDFVGRSMYTGDSFLFGSVDEFRIYYGALSASQIATNFSAGPNVLVPIQSPPVLPSLSAVLGTTTLVLSWPDTATGFTLQSTPVLGSGANWTAVSGTPTDANGSFSLTIPRPASSPAFFRLRK